MPDECEDFADLLDPYLDGELSPVMATTVRQHLDACPACAAEVAALRDLRAELHALRDERAPASLRTRLAAGAPRTVPRTAPRRRFAALAVAGVGGLLVGGVVGAGWRPGPDAAAELLTAHARSLLAEAPPQIAAGDPHRVRPWLSARLPVAPRVVDPAGFPLQGARLDLIGGVMVAALLYRRRAHAITVFAGVADRTTDWPATPTTRQGFNLLPWLRDGVRHVAVSDVALAELMALRDALNGDQGQP